MLVCVFYCSSCCFGFSFSFWLLVWGFSFVFVFNPVKTPLEERAFRACTEQTEALQGPQKTAEQ